MTVTKYFRLAAEQFYKIVELSAQQPLLRRFRLFVIFQDISDSLVEDR